MKIKTKEQFDKLPIGTVLIDSVNRNNKLKINFMYIRVKTYFGSIVVNDSHPTTVIDLTDWETTYNLRTTLEVAPKELQIMYGVTK